MGRKNESFSFLKKGKTVIVFGIHLCNVEKTFLVKSAFCVKLLHFLSSVE